MSFLTFVRYRSFSVVGNLCLAQFNDFRPNLGHHHFVLASVQPLDVYSSQKLLSSSKSTLICGETSLMLSEA